MALTACPDCGTAVSSEAKACLGCGRPIKKGASAPRLIVTSIVLVFLISMFFGVLNFALTSHVAPEANIAALPAPLLTASADDQSAMQAARAAYLHDRETLRTAKPRTEAEATKAIGRSPDNLMVLPQMTLVQWYYETKPVGRDVIQLSIEGGKVTAMNL